MPKGNKQKIKLVCLIKYLMEQTDEEHKVTMADILGYLEGEDIKAERKSIYSDMETLRELGIDVVGEKIGKGFHYYVASREFEVAELKLLVDAIQSSKFITQKKSEILIKKLQRLVSVHEAKQLQHHLYMAGRSKTGNENILYTVDTIHNALNQNKQISFLYFQWNTKKQMQLKKNGNRYLVSPWGVCWEDENYYLIAYDEQKKEIRHYRVDKMLGCQIEKEKRNGKGLFKEINMAEYSRKNFGMFHGEEETVSLLVHGSLIGVMIDRYGKDLMIVPAEDDWVRIHIKVAISNQFFGWIFGLGKGVRIVGPKRVKDKMKEQLSILSKLYEDPEI